MSRDAKQDILQVENLRAYYQMNYYGVEREVRAVDGITMSIKKGEVYGIAGESSSGKTSFIKVLAAAIRPPLRVIEGSVRYDFRNGPIDVATAGPAQIEDIRWKHLSYIMQGSMSVLNPVRRIGKTFRDFAARPLGLTGRAFEERVVAHLARLKLPPDVLHAYPHELSGGMRQRVSLARARGRSRIDPARRVLQPARSRHVADLASGFLRGGSRDRQDLPDRDAPDRRCAGDGGPRHRARPWR